ncbi:MAG: hypothetical protein NC910_00005 [Candidatus Omnitrophica bacterium]|nr:hypothetical protein [Candidatus Omnitrophota bacterium]
MSRGWKIILAGVGAVAVAGGAAYGYLEYKCRKDIRFRRHFRKNLQDLKTRVSGIFKPIEVDTSLLDQRHEERLNAIIASHNAAMMQQKRMRQGIQQQLGGPMGGPEVPPTGPWIDKAGVIHGKDDDIIDGVGDESGFTGN